MRLLSEDQSCPCTLHTWMLSGSAILSDRCLLTATSASHTKTTQTKHTITTREVRSKRIITIYCSARNIMHALIKLCFRESTVFVAVFVTLLITLTINPADSQYGYGGPGINYGTYNNWCNNFGNNNISFNTNNSVVNDVQMNMAEVTNTNNINNNNNFNYSFYFYGPLCTFYDNIVYPQPYPPPQYPPQQPQANYVYIPPAPEPQPQPQPEYEEPQYEEPQYESQYQEQPYSAPSPYIPIGSPLQYTQFNGYYDQTYSPASYDSYYAPSAGY